MRYKSYSKNLHNYQLLLNYYACIYIIVIPSAIANPAVISMNTPSRTPRIIESEESALCGNKLLEAHTVITTVEKQSKLHEVLRLSVLLMILFSPSRLNIAR